MKKFTVRQLALTALFVALILLLGLTKIGMIPLGFINISILAIPVVVGTLILGWQIGLILGLCFGIISALSAFGIYGAPSGLVAALMQKSPLLVVVMTFVPRLMIPVVTYLVHKAFAGHEKTKKIAVPAAAAAGSLTNTVLYLGLMLVFYFITGIDSRAVLAVIGGTGLIAGSLEAAANVLITTPVVAALRRIVRH